MSDRIQNTKAHPIEVPVEPADASAIAAGQFAGDTDPSAPAQKPASAERELGGPEGPEPTRFGDWERKGRCIDF